jgi:hypothetical protein
VRRRLILQCKIENVQGTATVRTFLSFGILYCTGRAHPVHEENGNENRVPEA